MRYHRSMFAAAWVGAMLSGPASAQTVDRLLPELTVRVSLVQSARIGDCNAVRLTVNNAGAATTSDVVVGYGAWPREDYDLRNYSTLRQRQFTLRGLGAGETRNLYVRNETMEHSGLFVTATVDPRKSLQETRETNNTDYATFIPSAVCYTYSVDDVIVSEGGTATFTIRKSGGISRETHYMLFETADGTAVGGSSCSTRGSGADFIARSGTLEFRPRDTAKTVSVQTCSDRVLDASEKFTLKIRLAPRGELYTGIQIVRRTGTGTIR